MNVIELFRKTCLSIVWITISAGLMAQNASPSLDKQVHVAAKEVDIMTLGDIITAQTGLILSFNAQKIIAQKQLWLPRPSYSIHQLLAMIKKATGAEYTIYREHIIFRRKPDNNTIAPNQEGGQTAKQVGAPVTNQQSHTRTGVKLPKITANKLSDNLVQRHLSAQTANNRSKAPISSGSHINHKEALQTAKSSNDSNNLHQDIATTDHSNKRTDITTAEISEGTSNTLRNIAGDSTAVARQQLYLLNYLTFPAMKFTSMKPATPTPLPVRPAIQQQKQRRQYEQPGLLKSFISTGFAADEVLYAHFQARAGVTLLYGIAAWSTNFSSSGFRYGAGSSYPLKNGWLIQLEATTGKLSKTTPILMDDTATVAYPLTTASRLQRINLFAQKSMTPHWSVYAGPVFNHLKSTYHAIVGQVSPATISQRGYATEKEYTIIRPLYTLSSSPSADLVDVKTWIGLQAGINYRF